MMDFTALVNFLLGPLCSMWR